MKFRDLMAVLICLLLISSDAVAQELKMLKPKDMKKDLSALQGTLFAHPDPLTKVAEADLVKLMVEAEEKIATPMDEIEFYCLLSEIVASLKDGHSGLYMPENWLLKRRKKLGAFPLEVYLDDSDNLFLLRSLNGLEIEPGSKIVEINDIPIAELIARLDPLVSYEKRAFRNAVITRNFEQYLYILFKTATDLKFKHCKLDTIETVVPTMPYKQWKKFQKVDQGEREKRIAIGKPYDYELLSPGVGKISIYSFSAADIDSYNLFLLSTFKEIRQSEVHSLVIDVRGNYGGWPKIASELFHYIHDGHFKTMAKSSMKVSKAYRNSYLFRYPGLREAVIMPTRRHFVDLDALINGELNTFVDESGFFNETPIEEKYEFSGDCYLLTDRRSYSASSAFAATFQCYSMGVIIGEETGGTKIFRANPMRGILPKSDFLVSMSTTLLHCACAVAEDESVIPHVEVKTNVMHLAKEWDPQLDVAMRLIKKVQKKKASEAEAGKINK